MVYAIILAGGSGTRFWPLSRRNKPKQFLNLLTNKPAIELAIQRIKKITRADNIYIATNKIHHPHIKTFLLKHGIPLKNILFEPSSRNTFAPIGLLSMGIYKRDPFATIMVLPSDHYFKNEQKFTGILKKAVAAANSGSIITLGIPPDRPETGYGYIKIKPGVKDRKSKVYEVERFVEKPNLKKAKEYIKDKRYFWNGGIFVFKATVMLSEIERITPKDYAVFEKIEAIGLQYKLWAKLTSLSIDYAIMERTKRICLIPMKCGWIDLGSWQSIELLATKDRNGNIFKGKIIDLDCKNTLCWSQSKPIAILGLEDLIVINTDDALLVCRKDKTQDIRRLVKLLQDKGYARLT